jgi:hypothetical protein
MLSAVSAAATPTHIQPRARLLPRQQPLMTAHLQRAPGHAPLAQQRLHARHQEVVVPNGGLRAAVCVVNDDHGARGQLRHLLW